MTDGHRTQPPQRPARPPQANALVVTPEAVPLDLQLAGLGSRFLALMLDWIIQGVAAIAVGFGLVAILDRTDTSAGVAQALLFIFLFLIFFGYPVVLETVFRGRTIGKAAAGLRVVTVEGAPVGFRHAAIRASLGLVDFLFTSGAGAVLSSLLTEKNQRLGDLVAGTIVLKERTGLPKPTAVEFTVDPAHQAYAATLDTSGLSADDYRIVRSFLLRAPALQPDVRDQLAVQIARPLSARVQPPPSPAVPAEQFLTCVAAAYQRRSAPQAVAPSPTSESAGPAAEFSPSQATDVVYAPPPADVPPLEPRPRADADVDPTPTRATEDGFEPMD